MYIHFPIFNVHKTGGEIRAHTHTHGGDTRLLGITERAQQAAATTLHRSAARECYIWATRKEIDKVYSSPCVISLRDVFISIQVLHILYIHRSRNGDVCCNNNIKNIRKLKLYISCLWISWTRSNVNGKVYKYIV